MLEMFGCPPPDSTPALGALGVMSAEGRHSFRSVIRSTWMPDSEATANPNRLLVRFVLRGLKASVDVVAEATEFRDVVFVAALATLPRTVGPLHSLFGWWRCTLSAWPNAKLVGKADDDVWIDLPGIEWQLLATRRALRGRPRESTLPAEDRLPLEDRLCWGLMETFHWSFEDRRPYGFRFKYGYPGASCYNTPDLNKSGTIRSSGPFHFPKGPLFFLSRSLVADIVRADGEQQLDDITRTFLTGGVNSSNTTARVRGVLPWDDVFTGMKLATVVAGSGLVAVHSGLLAFAEPWGAYPGYFLPRSSTLLWHETLKLTTRLGLVHSWAHRRKANRCPSPPLSLSCDTSYRSCTGAPWTRCVTDIDHKAAGCDVEPRQNWIDDACPPEWLKYELNSTSHVLSLCKQLMAHPSNSSSGSQRQWTWRSSRDAPAEI